MNPYYMNTAGGYQQPHLPSYWPQPAYPMMENLQQSNPLMMNSTSNAFGAPNFVTPPSNPMSFSPIPNPSNMNTTMPSIPKVESAFEPQTTQFVRPVAQSSASVHSKEKKFIDSSPVNPQLNVERNEKPKEFKESKEKSSLQVTLTKKESVPTFTLPPKPKVTPNDASLNHHTPTTVSFASMSANGNNVRPHSTTQKKPNQRYSKMTVPDSEFDFESANAKFDKNEIVPSEAESPLEAVYYQKSSFFDDISCEMKDRQEFKR